MLFRSKPEDGSWGNFLVNGSAVEYRDDSPALPMFESSVGLSRLEPAYTDLGQSQQLLELVLDTVPQAIFWQDENFRYRGANQQFIDLAGLVSLQHLIGLSNDDLWWRDRAEDFLVEDRALLAGKLSSHRAQVEMQHEDGLTSWYDIIKVPMSDAHGNTIGILGAVHDISSQKEAACAAQHLAHFDRLTGLPNRRYFTERLESAVAAAKIGRAHV